MAEVQAGDVRLHVQQLGCSGPIVVFLHGLIMDNLSSWYFTAATRIAQFSKVILFDLRGHGMSERPIAGYGVDNLVTDLETLLRATAWRLDTPSPVPPVHLVGNSFGGLLALAFAARNPTHVGSIALVDSQVPVPGWGQRMAATLSLQGESRTQMIAESFKDWMGRHSQRKRTRLQCAAEALVYRTSIIEDLRHARALSQDELVRIRCPVLALYGEQSDVRAEGEQLAKQLPDCSFQVIPQATHSVLWEATDDVMAALQNWILAHKHARGS